MTNSIPATMKISKKQLERERKAAELRNIASYITARGQATSLDVMAVTGTSACTVSRQLRILCLAGAIHQITKYSGRAGGHAVYGPGPVPVDADGEALEECVALRQNRWPDGLAHRDPMVAALFGAPVTVNTVGVASRLLSELEIA